jgi:polyisoprenoid-binding protein YceI
MTNPAARTAGIPQAGEWAAEPAGSTVSFTVRNFGLRSVTGIIPLTSASVTIGRSGQPVSIRAELDARGIDTYQASDVQASGPGWTVDGTLTVKDCHCPVRMDVNGPDIPQGDPAAPVSLRATARLDRRSAGVTTAPAFLIGRTIWLSLAVRLRPPADIPATSGRPATGTKAPAKEEHR